MSRLASTTEVESQKFEESETQRSIAEARVSALEAELNSKLSTIENLEKSIAEFQGEVTQLMLKLDVAKKKASNMEERNTQLNTARDETVAH